MSANIDAVNKNNNGGEWLMGKRNWSRREMLGASVGSVAATLFAEPLKAAAPATAVTPELFEAKYPSISVRVERSGAERIFQRIAQENDSGIHAVDVANSTDVSHYLEWKKNGWLTPYVPEDVVKYFPDDQFDPDGLYATSCAWLEAIGYNTNLVKAEDAPKSYADLLDPKWRGKLVKGHPSYSGAILTT